MGPSGAGAPNPLYVGSFLRSAEAHFAKKCTFSQKVHFFAISAPKRRQKHRRLSLYLESAQKVRKIQFGRPLLRNVRFRHPRIGKTRVHVVNLQNGDFCDDFCEIFPFSEKCVSETGFLYTCTAFLLKIKKSFRGNNIFAGIWEKSLKWPTRVLSMKTNGFWGAETHISALL